MHDIGSTQTELASEFDHESSQEFNAEGPFEFEFEQNESFALPGEALESPFGEIDEVALAAELLEVSNEQELDHFLGSLIKKAGQIVGKVVKSPIGKALGGALKGVLKTAAPIAGGALGTFLGGPVGGMLGSKLGSFVGSKLELNAELADRDFEVARDFVRLAGTAVNRALQAADHPNAIGVAHQAVSETVNEMNFEVRVRKPSSSHGSRGGGGHRQRRRSRTSYGGYQPAAPVPPWAVSPYIIPAWACASVNAPGGPSDAPPDGADPGGGEIGEMGEYETAPPPPGSAGGPPQHLRHHLPASGKWYRKGRSIVLVLG